jgi:hypothetical protein
MKKTMLILIGITMLSFGACKDKCNDTKQSCIDKSKINPELNCPENIDFVCGCDGITYNNECEAKKNGVTKFKSGTCDNH